MTAPVVLVVAVLVTVVPASAAYAQAPDTGSGTPRALSAAFSYTAELVTDAAGGARRGTIYAGAASAQLTLLLHRIVGWRGARVFVFVLGTHGGAPSDLVGDVQGVSNLQAPAAVRLEEAWLQQNLFANHLSWLVGRYDLSTEFYRLQSSALFLNSSFGTGAEIAQSGVAGPSIFPRTAVGTRVDVKPSPNTVWRAAVLDGVPVDRPEGGPRIFAPGDGALLVSEVALLSRPDTAGVPRHPRFQVGRRLPRPYTAKLAIGGWYYTAHFPDLVDTLASGAPVKHRGSGGAYLIADRVMWSAHRQPGGLSAFVQLGLGDSRVNTIGRYAGGGLTLTGPLPSRAQDEVGLAVAAAFPGSRYERARSTTGSSVTAETTVELTYLIQLGSAIAVQPDLQYVMHPGETRATRNALVPGVRVALSQ